MQTTSPTQETTDGIIVPPGCDNPIFHNCGESVSTYTPNSYTPFKASNFSNYLPHPMHGKSGSLSVSGERDSLPQKSMTDYLNQFKGAYLCLDLWIDSHTKLKKCGYLTEVGSGFLVLHDKNLKSFTVLDLKPVRYINIYCR